MSSVPLKRVNGIARAAMILVGVAGGVAVATVPVGRSVVDDAERFLDGETTDTEFVEGIAPYMLLGVVQIIAIAASAVLVMIWMFRLAANHRTLHRGGTWGPGWAIGGWFLPPLLYIIPFLMFRELWKASDPDVPVGGEWRQGPISPLVTIWFVVYSIVPLGMIAVQSNDTFSGLGGDERDLAQQIVDGGASDAIAAAIAVAGAVAFILLARQLTRRHQRLTGEISA
jgi:hypothetical protein